MPRSPPSQFVILTTQAVPISNDVLYQSVVKFDSKVYLNKVIDKTVQIECIGVESDVEVVTYSQKNSLKFHSRRLYIYHPEVYSARKTDH